MQYQNTYPQFTILTESNLFHHKLIQKAKQVVRILLGMKVYGPMGVFHSLLRGLKELGIHNYNINPDIKYIHQTVCVLLGADTLKYAIKLKKDGVIKKIIAGPNISVALHKDNIFFHPLVDNVVVPSKWIHNFFLNLDPALIHRLVVWPAGVEDTGIVKKQKKNILIYKKSCPQGLFDYIISYMEKHHIAYDIIIYGSFDQQDYQKKINNSIALIYLQESETQGLALQEAWIKDVPTLVWNRGYREYQGNRWYDDHISAPYLTHQAGLFFESEIDFEKNLQILLKKIDSQSFSPRAYCLEHLTDKICSENYLDIISKL